MTRSGKNGIYGNGADGSRSGGNRSLGNPAADFYGSRDAGGGSHHWFRGSGTGLCQPEGRVAGAADLASGCRFPFGGLHALCGGNGPAHPAAPAAFRAGGKICGEDRILADLLFRGSHQFLQPDRLYHRLREDPQHFSGYSPGRGQPAVFRGGHCRGLAGPEGYRGGGEVPGAGDDPDAAPAGGGFLHQGTGSHGRDPLCPLVLGHPGIQHCGVLLCGPVYCAGTGPGLPGPAG